MELCEKYQEMLDNIVRCGLDYLIKYPKIESLILGISGGIDSTLTAAIASKICKKMPRECKLIGVHIPIEPNTQEDFDWSSEVGNTFCDELNIILRPQKIMNIFYEEYARALTLEEKIRKGNIKARLRMIELYDIAHKNNGIVLSTDNRTENYLGFWTLHGDVGDLGFIQNLWKTEVYGIAKFLVSFYNRSYRGRPIYYSIQATPTDGLGITDSDFDQLGVDSYEEADKILIDYLNSLNADWDCHDHPIITRYINSQYKRNNPFSILREHIIPQPKTKIF